MEIEDDSSMLQNDFIGVGDQVGYGVQPFKVPGSTCDSIQETYKKRYRQTSFY